MRRGRGRTECGEERRTFGLPGEVGAASGLVDGQRAASRAYMRSLPVCGGVARARSLSGYLPSGVSRYYG